MVRHPTNNWTTFFFLLLPLNLDVVLPLLIIYLFFNLFCCILSCIPHLLMCQPAHQMVSCHLYCLPTVCQLCLSYSSRSNPPAETVHSLGIHFISYISPFWINAFLHLFIFFAGKLERTNPMSLQNQTFPWTSVIMDRYQMTDVMLSLK